MDFEGLTFDFARVEIENSVHQLAALHPRRADEHTRSAVRRFACELSDRFNNGALEGGFQHKVFGRIADEEQLAEHDEVSARHARRTTGLERLLEIACNVAHCGVELRKRDAEFVGHLAIYLG